MTSRALATQTNWIDGFIAFCSPKAGLRRLQNRAAMAAILLAYDGARTGRRTEGWIVSGNSAASEVAPALKMLRERSRDLIRNNAYGAKAVSEFVNNVVGTGIVPQARTGVPDLDQRINEVWQEWSEECDADGQLNFDGLVAMICRAEFESGEVLLRFRPRFASDGLRVPLQLQVFEPDYIDSSKTISGNGSYVVLGIQFNQLGKREGYWLFGDHPGDNNIKSARASFQSRLVPASEILHFYRKDRPGMPRGVPRLAPVMTAMRDLGDYEDAELIRKKIEACFTAFVTQSDDANPPMGTVTTEQGTGQRLEGFRPGGVYYLKTGESVTFGSPANVPGYRDYKTTKLQELAAGIGFPDTRLSGDLTGVNYSSFKAGDNSFKAMIEVYRWLNLIPMVCLPIWYRVIETAAAAGVLPVPILPDGTIAPEYYRVEWTAPTFPSIEPVKDATANLLKIRSGELTIRENIAQAGYDPDTQLRAIAAEQQWLRENGVVLDSDPSQVTGAGVFQPKAEGQPSETSEEARS